MTESGGAAPPPLPPKQGHGPLFWILVVLGGLFVLCCGGVVALYLLSRATMGEFLERSAAERHARVEDRLDTVSDEQMRAASEFIRAIDEERDEDAWAMTAPGFRILTPREHFLEQAELVGQGLGRCRSKTLRSARCTERSGGGSTASLEFDAQFEQGEATIRLDLVEVGGTWRIAAWQTDSPVLDDARKGESGK